MTEQLVAFHGKQTVKTKFLKRVEAHRKADRIIHGTYWQEGRGCAVGCTVQVNDGAHEQYPKELGLPKWLAYLEDRLFESMTREKSFDWPSQFLKAIPVGAVNWELVRSKFFYAMLMDEKMGVINYVLDRYSKASEIRTAIRNVASLHKRIIEGGTVTTEEWQAARNAAAYAAAAAAAAAYAAAAADAAAADAAAYAAAYAAADAAARKNMFDWMAEKLLELLKDMKVPAKKRARK